MKQWVRQTTPCTLKNFIRIFTKFLIRKWVVCLFFVAFFLFCFFIGFCLFFCSKENYKLMSSEWQSKNLKFSFPPPCFPSSNYAQLLILISETEFMNPPVPWNNSLVFVSLKLYVKLIFPDMYPSANIRPPPFIGKFVSNSIFSVVISTKWSICKNWCKLLSCSVPHHLLYYRAKNTKR